ncbi:MAG: M48 family metalloprotease [Phycisphaera sp.]|nr:M48 family metalloprotease [Phycisphaera sp.]
MSDSTQGSTKQGFVKTFVLPALLIFLIPVISLLFFKHVQSYYDEQARVRFLRQIREDKKLTAENRAAAEKLFTEVPLSELVTRKEFSNLLTSEGEFNFGVYRWAIRLSMWSIIGGVAVFALGGICVLASLRSQYAQYVSLSIGWHVLRLFSAAQVFIQGVLIIALSYWVTAFWFEIYVPKLIILAAVFTLIAVGATIKAIFTKPSSRFEVEGVVIDRDASPPLWQELEAICRKVGTETPDQVIAGIDDNFFVTEQPVIVDKETYKGRTLFVSLSLLKQLEGGEADAVLAHEMAHFSGNDTVYSEKISPLLIRYGHYLQGLYAGGASLPVFYFMNCFRALFQLSLGRLSREREFRADRIAVEVTSPDAMAGALLRIVAYANYRAKVQDELFMQEEVLEVADVSKRIEDGFPQYAASFLAQPDVGNLETAHPFDSHPPLAERLQAVGASLQSEHSQQALSTPGDGAWFRRIDAADDLERAQWDEFEQKFRAYHEETLPYRFLPATDQERAIVLKAFPDVAFAGKDGTLRMTCDQIEYDPWPGAIRFENITHCKLNEGNVLAISHTGGKPQNLKLARFGNGQEILAAFQKYYGRYLAAKNYQEHMKQKREAEAESSADASS